jgi:hypothetical protein
MRPNSRVLLGSRLMAGWRNDLCIRSTNTIGRESLGLARALSQDNQCRQASALGQEIRRHSHLASDPLRGRAAASALAKETRNCALPFK